MCCAEELGPNFKDIQQSWPVSEIIQIGMSNKDTVLNSNKKPSITKQANITYGQNTIPTNPTIEQILSTLISELLSSGVVLSAGVVLKQKEENIRSNSLLYHRSGSSGWRNVRHIIPLIQKQIKP